MGTLIHLMQKCHHKRFIQTSKKKGFVNNNLLQQVKCHFTMGYCFLAKKKLLDYSPPITDKNLKGTLGCVRTSFTTFYC